MKSPAAALKRIFDRCVTHVLPGHDPAPSPVLSSEMRDTLLDHTSHTQPSGTLHKAWRLIRKYFTDPDTKPQARVLLGRVLAFNVAYLAVGFATYDFSKSFFNALGTHNNAVMPAIAASAAGIGITKLFSHVAREYHNRSMQMHYRENKTYQMGDDYINHGTYTRPVKDLPASPEQELTADLSGIPYSMLALSIGALAAVANGAWFSIRFSHDTRAFDFAGVHMGPLVQLGIATGLSAAAILLLQKTLTNKIRLDNQQQRQEAGLRRAVLRLSKDLVGIKTIGGEDREKELFRSSFQPLTETWKKNMKLNVVYDTVSTSYSLAALALPFAIAYPAYSAGQIGLGEVMAIATALANIQNSLSYIIGSASHATALGSEIHRVDLRETSLEEAKSRPRTFNVNRLKGHADMVLRDLTIWRPDGKLLIENISHTFKPGDRVLIRGDSGCGKSTLMKVLADAIPHASGTIDTPEKDAILINPQSGPFPPIDLLNTVAYPSNADDFTPEQITQVIIDVGLGEQLKDAERTDWDHSLSGGERQRVAFARVLLNKPKVVGFDEVTANLDKPSARRLLAMVDAQLQNSVSFFITHDHESIPGITHVAAIDKDSRTMTVSEIGRSPSNDLDIGKPAEKPAAPSPL